MNYENIALAIGAIVTALGLANEKIRNAILGRATFKKETTDATDDAIETLMNRVNVLTDEFTRLSEENIKHKKAIIHFRINCKNQCDATTERD
mgnify:CR=1 FL=1